MQSFIFRPDDPRSADMRKRQAVMDALQGNAARAPQDIGQGIAALGGALAYRSLARRQEQAAVDPWHAMRGTAPASPFAAFGNGLKGLFGLGAR